MKITINDKEKKVLKILVEDAAMEGDCFYFRYISKKTKLIRAEVRRICRSLAKKELAKYERGLFDDEGMTAGSGYGATMLGIDFINNI